MILNHKIQKEYEEIVYKGVKDHQISGYSVKGEGFLTAVGKKNFPLTQVLYAFLKARTTFPLTIIDLGMNKYQLEWLYEYTDCYIIKPDKINYDELPPPCGSSYDPRTPYYLSLTPYSRATCWIASDTVLLKNYTYLFIMGTQRPTAFRGNRYDIANTEFYNTFRYSATMHPACTSIFMYSYIRDYDIIKKWIEFTRIYIIYPHLRDLIIRPSDAGLIWSDIHNHVSIINDATLECIFIKSLEVKPWIDGVASPPIFPFLGIHHNKTAIVFSEKETPWSNWTTEWGDKILPFQPNVKFPSR